MDIVNVTKLNKCLKTWQLLDFEILYINVRLKFKVSGTYEIRLISKELKF